MMSNSSYDELMKHLRCLKVENSHLHHELRVNSSHLTRLEIDASTMKDRLTHKLHHATMVEDNGSAVVNASHTDQDFERTLGTGISLPEAVHYNLHLHDEEDPVTQNRPCFVNSSSSSEVSHKKDCACLHSRSYHSASPDSEAGIFSGSGDSGLKKPKVLGSGPTLPGKHLESERTAVAEPGVNGEECQSTATNKVKTDRTSDGNAESNVPGIEVLPVEVAVASLNNQNGTDGQTGSTKLITIATQTTDVYLPGASSSFQDSIDWQNSRGSQNLSTLYHGGWPLENGLGSQGDGSFNHSLYQDAASVMSFALSNVSSSASYKVPHRQFGTKVEMVYSLLSMLGTHDKDDMSQTLLAMSNSQDSCIAMRQSGCIPLLIQLLHGNSKDMHLLGNTRGSRSTRARAATALHNIVHSNPDNKSERREGQVLHLLEQIRAYCDQLRSSDDEAEDEEVQPGSSRVEFQCLVSLVAALMKLSFDEEHRQAICNLGGLQAIAELLELDQEANGNTTEPYNIAMRRYGCMTLTNLTFGDGTNKALLCSHRAATRALVAFLRSTNEDLCQMAASVLRNLSWHADPSSKQILREVGSEVELMQAAMRVEKESTLKSILSALWNLSAHCSENKEDICAVDGALKFLVSTLTYQSPSESFAVIENGGGVLRNISSHIAVCEDYRAILRQHGCLQILLRHLESSCLGIVSNACGTLWNLSARCATDQQTLWELGAVKKLRNLIHSKHKMISMGSAAALKNLLSARPDGANDERLFAVSSPGLHVRRQRAIEAELKEQELSETYDNVDRLRSQPIRSRSQDSSQVTVKLSCMSVDNDAVRAKPSFDQKGSETVRSETGTNVGRSESQDSVGSTHSDISHDRNRILKASQRDMQPLASEKHMNENNRVFLLNNPKLGRLMKLMLDTKVNLGVQPGDVHIYDSYLAKGPYSLESSPASHRRHQGTGVSRFNSPGETVATNYLRNPVGYVGVKTAHNTEVGPGKKATYTPPEDLLNFSHLSPCMEQLHLTAPELDQEQDEPINFSTKYVEISQEPTGTSPVPVTSASRPVNQPGPAVRGVGVQPIVSQSTPNLCQMAPLRAVSSNLLMTNTAFTNTQQALSGRLAHLSESGPVASIRLNALKPMKGPGAGSDTSGYVSKVLLTHPHTQGRILPGFSRYGKPELDLEMSEQPTNYSIQFAEHNDDDDERTFVEQPINYSTRYTEHETPSHTTFNLPPVNNAACEFSDDTVTTFCTEGTPMNFLSTATSMNDLSCKAAHMAQKKAEAPIVRTCGDALERTKSHSDAECSSMSGSQSTDHKTTSTVIVGKNSDDGKARKALGPDGIYLDQVVHIPSGFSYKDSAGTVSPYEKPKSYCTEGTPTSFSNSSSLSNLLISEAGADESSGKSIPKPGGMSLPNIDENSAVDGLKCPETKTLTLVHEGSSSGPISHHIQGGTTKTVTFDDNNQIQETPLMFSRCSSLGSLSSFDTHSVHSSVVSEYSRRASEVVSPSDLPDSPCDTMPPSPSYKCGTAKFPADPVEVGKVGSLGDIKKQDQRKLTKVSEDSSQQVLQLSSNLPLSGIPVIREQDLEFSAQSSPVVYAEEGSVCAFSGRTSLSALTTDEDLEIPGKPKQQCTSLREEEQIKQVSQKGSSDSNAKPEKADISIEDDEDDDDDDDSSVTEGEENLLAECISMALPSKSSKQMVHSHSDSLLKQKQVLPRGPAGMASYSAVKIMPSPSLGTIQARKGNNQSHQKAIYCSIPEVTDTVLSGHDSPKKYATEDTPLNFSHSGSLGDLSGDNDLANVTVRFVEKPKDLKPNDADDNNSDVSSLSDSNEDLEGLLSEVIEAAMPKSNKKQSSKSVRNETKSTTNAIPSMARLGRFPALQIPRPSSQGAARSANDYSQMINTNSELGADGVKTYAIEGTPVEFSRSTSLSNLTIESTEEGASERFQNRMQNAEFQPVNRPVPTGKLHGLIRNPNFQAHVLPSEDSMHSYLIEGTPAVFSRNDSLSSLSEEDEVPVGRVIGTEGFKEENKTRPHSEMTNTGTKTQPDGKAAHHLHGAVRLRAPNVNLRMSSYMSPNLTSTPVGKQIRLPIVGQEDQVIQYAVEGTPENVSRNLSPTPLGNRYTVKNMRSYLELDQSSCFHVEDTPAHFSCNSSLSSLSLESFNFEPTPSEAAMLEECINAALPKSKKRAAKADVHPLTAVPHKGSKSSTRLSFERDSNDGTQVTANQKTMSQSGKAVSKVSSHAEVKADGKVERLDAKQMHGFKDRSGVRFDEQHLKMGAQKLVNPPLPQTTESSDLQGGSLLRQTDDANSSCSYSVEDVM